MIKANEFRLGNYVLQKKNNRVSTAVCSYEHFEMMAKNDLKDLFAVVLKSELLQKCGFNENVDYPLLPDAREFILLLPVNGSHKNEIHAYIKNNGECFARATLDGAPASNSIYFLHQLQNLYYSLTGEELLVRL